MTNSGGTKCPKCEKSIWEASKESPIGMSVQVLFVRCAACKTAVGIMDDNDLAEMLRQVKEMLQKRQ